jgi:hypothetical protein
MQFPPIFCPVLSCYSKKMWCNLMVPKSSKRVARVRCCIQLTQLYPELCRRCFLSFCLWLCSPCWPWPLFQFPNLYTAGRTSSTGDQPVARQVPTYRTTRTQNNSKETSTSWVGFGLTVPAFERVKTVHALNSVATVIDRRHILFTKYIMLPFSTQDTAH